MGADDTPLGESSIQTARFLIEIYLLQNTSNVVNFATAIRFINISAD